jgi:hypothetical protein
MAVCGLRELATRCADRSQTKTRVKTSIKLKHFLWSYRQPEH